VDLFKPSGKQVSVCEGFATRPLGVYVDHFAGVFVRPRDPEIGLWHVEFPEDFAAIPNSVG
jgi:hypothetical protein